jgi:glycosyltransferase involved in cell wall biosynthesis
MLKVAVNTRLLLYNRLEGIGRFMFETLSRIVKNHPEVEFHFIFDRPFHSDFIFGKNVIPHVLFPQARHPFLFYIWFEWQMPRLLQKINPDVFLSPDGYLSLRTQVKQLPVIHDLNFAEYPNDLPKLMSKYYNYYFPKFAKKAERIVTVSHFSKKDIEQRFEIDAKRIDVVYNAAGENFTLLSEEQKHKIRHKFTEGKPYFMFLSSIHPRKNLGMLLKAFDRFKSKNMNDVQLLIVGEKYYWTKELQQQFENVKHKSDIIFIGRLQSNEVNQLLAASIALVYISYYEGFGIPIVEAFHSGTAVITSNVTAMPETAGNAALLVDPFNENDITNAMWQLYTDNDLRNELIAKGLERRWVFSWEQAANDLWNSITKITNA